MVHVGLLKRDLFSPLCHVNQRLNFRYELNYELTEYHIQPQRMSRVGKFGRIIIKAPGESGTLLSTRAWDQVSQLSDLRSVKTTKTKC